MNVEENGSGDRVVDLCAAIITAYVSNNAVPPNELPPMIGAVHSTLTQLMAPPAPEPPKPEPPIPIRRTVTADHIISLEDGKPYKTLKRHLAGRGLTPEQYREKWGLPRDYPMVAATYASQRSELAKNSGLGRRRLRGAEGGDGAPENNGGGTGRRGRPRGSRTT
ncbi:MucR family transcriptional regulator [Methylobacterium platani]|uniref:MucR family transcriptional regulator n=2 Tax=Methylobacterium platani TaxID=427683 RepID=A0A179SEE8_9HYPH|nr:MucR family transcriptional regulator [Methylobacterium platani]KMO14712.1 MucR family transcriptional regulator [Methylobacterium platani JCM 14648]OAS26245.1 MucR family transcriptional regulator [Methylobacterium platani]